MLTQSQKKGPGKETKPEKKAGPTQKDRVAAFKYRVSLMQWSSDPHINVEQERELLERAEKGFADDPGSLLALREHIQKAAREGAAGKGVFDTAEGKLVLAYIKDNYRKSSGEFQNLAYDEHWYGDGDNSQTFMAARYYEILDLARIRLAKGENAQKVIADIKALVAKVNDGKSKVIMDRRSEGEQKPKPTDQGESQPQPQPLKVGTVVNGYKYLGGDPAKSENWRKVE